MKITFVVLALGILGSVAVAGEAPPADAQKAYAKAVATYIEGATNESAAIRQQFDALKKDATEETKQRLETFSVPAKFDAFGKALESLKKSVPDTFDKLKAEYEIARESAKKALAAAKGP